MISVQVLAVNKSLWKRHINENIQTNHQTLSLISKSNLVPLAFQCTTEFIRKLGLHPGLV